MTQPDAWPYPEPHEWVDEPDPATRQAIDEAREDIAAGRFIRCNDENEFDALLASLSAEPYPQAS
ncbi:hypothetical protein [Frankia sp. Cr1]|uniref:hypothetical protein n=1 Tax=Frankia sp. Cr1 TaxID=3073931 RepID=UPI002AD4C8C5|nr:hypothetical protein [Frankia sp. Cr1]